ncbi:MAG: helix-turn-helix transcriptional regulator [Rhodocyclaceae bacterium]|nr:helix-turn-helix transcriptional regulator [Rhodocyclaceae bacterium]
MARKRFSDMNCGVAQALEALGDWWTLLIIRDAFFGVRRFTDFQASLGIARNILTDRLNRLVDHGILERIDVGDTGLRYEYRLTPKGEGLLPLLTALREWSDAWVFGPGREPVVAVEKATGRPLPGMRVRNAEGRELGRHELRIIPGPGASAETLEMLARRPRSKQPRRA